MKFEAIFGQGIRIQNNRYLLNTYFKKQHANIEQNLYLLLKECIQETRFLVKNAHSNGLNETKGIKKNL